MEKLTVCLRYPVGLKLIKTKDNHELNAWHLMTSNTTNATKEDIHATCYTNVIVAEHNCKAQVSETPSILRTIANTFKREPRHNGLGQEGRS